MENIKKIENLNLSILRIIKESTTIGKLLYRIDQSFNPTLYFTFFVFSIITTLYLAINKILPGSLITTLLILLNLTFAMFCFWRDNLWWFDFFRQFKKKRMAIKIDEIQGEFKNYQSLKKYTEYLSTKKFELIRERNKLLFIELSQVTHLAKEYKDMNVDKYISLIKDKYHVLKELNFSAYIITCHPEYDTAENEFKLLKDVFLELENMYHEIITKENKKR